ncbi:hypothetical protein MY3296_008801 [Beauveria thailandica]
MDDSDPEPVYKSADAAAADADAPATTNANAEAGIDDDDYDDDDDGDDDYDDDADAPSSTGSRRGQKANPVALTTTGDMEHQWEQLELEKSRYPGASTWAPDEERLFELLFFRQDLPILPSHWELDMSAVPISEANFADVENAPIVYAHSTDFRATTALVRLIELTAAIRTTSESGLHRRVPGMIKDGLDRFLAWAAEDGGYSHLRVVPNIITEIVDTKMQEGDITALLQRRMRALARLQREFLRADRDPGAFWRDVATAVTEGGDEDDDDGDDDVFSDRNSLLLQSYLSPRRDRHANKYRQRNTPGRRRQPRRSDNSAEDELAQTTADHSGAAPRRRRPFATVPATELDELAQPGDSVTGLLSSSASERDGLFSPAASTASLVSSPSPAAVIRYRRPPPVVYGFFILNSSVFILTADASRGDNAYVSFHVETDFLDQRQSVWNALTLAIVTCRARDDMRRRTEDFEPLAAEEDSDPDL